ncbi:MAG: pantetheine-phosphate adenylyltransferase [Paludibacteraceae bacterium]|jgi:pantetheine-phosphate adenylyltransferase|nr:pantetheine-phosphate adenylyltransferase [Paludibacteraceae bacterium]MED9995347.1 pantetheine-phosphate adenylyltransferase [Paludibacteraceae bacterium]
MRTAIFPGSFNPFTQGHANIVSRALTLFDRVIIAIGQNSEKDNGNMAQNVEAITALYANNARIKVLSYQCLTADLVQKENATCIIRGIRNESDLAYEQEIAQANYTFFNVETIFLLASPQLKEVSSSMVRELKKYGKDVSNLLPQTDL